MCLQQAKTQQSRFVCSRLWLIQYILVRMQQSNQIELIIDLKQKTDFDQKKQSQNYMKHFGVVQFGHFASKGVFALLWQKNSDILKFMVSVEKRGREVEPVWTFFGQGG